MGGLIRRLKTLESKTGRDIPLIVIKKCQDNFTPAEEVLFQVDDNRQITEARSRALRVLILRWDRKRLAELRRAETGQ